MTIDYVWRKRLRLVLLLPYYSSLLFEITATTPSDDIFTRTANKTSQNFGTTIASRGEWFEAEPAEKTLVKEGDNGITLKCRLAQRVRDRSKFEVQWFRIAGGAPKILSRNDENYSSEHYEVMNDRAKGEYDLHIKAISLAHDNGQFYCSVMEMATKTQISSRAAHVVVMTTPSEPVIAQQPSAALREMDLIVVKCESAGGNPIPTFRWLLPNGTEIPRENHHETNVEAADVNMRKAVSTLRWYATRDDNEDYRICSVRNEALEERQPSLQAMTNRFNVQYAPRVTVGPLAELTAEEGTLVELTCKADANPAATKYLWTLPDGTAHYNPIWQVPMKRAHSGEIKCSATNSIGTGESHLQLNVLYGPQTRVRSAIGRNSEWTASPTVNPRPGDYLRLECDVDSSPPPDRIVWSGPNGFENDDNRKEVVVSDVTLDHIGNFTCTASNTLHSLYMANNQSHGSVSRSASASILVDVKRKPGPAVISTARQTVNEGERISLECAVRGDTGSPMPKFRWTTPRDHEATDHKAELSQLDITHAELADNGLYKCHAYNEMGAGEEAVLKIIVAKPPLITRGMPNMQEFSDGDKDVSLQCEVAGYPLPHVKWLKDGIPLATEFTTTYDQHWRVHEEDSTKHCADNEVCAQSVISKLNFVSVSGVRWNDKGNYTCLAVNEANLSSTSPSQYINTSTLRVKHGAVILNRRHVVDGGKRVALQAADTGSTAEIRCELSAYPHPIAKWYRQGKEIEDESEGEGGGGDFHQYRILSAKLSHLGTMDVYESVLEVRDVKEEDYGPYECRASNSLNAVNKPARIEIQLRRKDIPQVPTNVRPVEIGTTWLQLGWMPGFDGGEEQRFELEVRAVDPYSGNVDESRGVNEYLFESHNSTYRRHSDLESGAIRGRRDKRRRWLALTEPPVDGEEDYYMVHNLTRLRPMSAYWYRVRSSNVRGSSEWTPIASVSTLDAKETKELVAPYAILYHANEKKITVRMGPAHDVGDVEAATPMCILLYAYSGENWRSVDCYPTTSIAAAAAEDTMAIHPVEQAERFRARLCRRDDLAHCSAAVDFFASSVGTSIDWSGKKALVVSAMIAVMAVAILFAVMLICFRRRRAGLAAATLVKRRKKLSERLQLNGGIVVDRVGLDGQLKHKDTRTTVVHGSQNDSGVFTLQSSGNGVQTRISRIEEAANSGLKDSPDPPALDDHGHSSHAYDFNNDPYLEEMSVNLTRQYFGGTLPTHSQMIINHHEAFDDGMGGVAVMIDRDNRGGNSNEQLVIPTDSSDTASVYNGSQQAGGGRVMREIIV